MLFVKILRIANVVGSVLSYDLLCVTFNGFVGCFLLLDEVQFALAGGGGVPELAEVKRVRSLFPETWIWLEYDAR